MTLIKSAVYLNKNSCEIFWKLERIGFFQFGIKFVFKIYFCVKIEREETQDKQKSEKLTKDVWPDKLYS